MFTRYVEAELNQIILNQIEENLHLDYKGAGSLGTTEGKKKEISKDISAFANSDGGLIIYGIKEFDDPLQRHLPEIIDPINRRTFSKEWLEQVINSNIQPKIEGLIIYPITLSSGVSDVVYVVNIPKSKTANQSSDKRYYRRYNFESVAMEDYEIKVIINRLSSPDLELVLKPSETTYISNKINFPIRKRNKSKILAKDVKLTIRFNDANNYNCENFDGFENISNINPGLKIYSTNREIRIYNGADAYIGKFTLQLNSNVLLTQITATIFGDKMFPVTTNFDIIIENNTPNYRIH
ncbi:MAG: ATP-binding protein [Saprospiraceae bacterium]|nr:ATP-binding protein [Saprospiraceae bacterium]